MVTKAEQKGLQKFVTFPSILRKTGWLIFCGILFLILLIQHLINPHASPASSLNYLVHGILHSDSALLDDPHYQISNDKTALYGKEVLSAWHEANREGKKILEQAQRHVRQKGPVVYRQLDELEKEDIEQWHYRRILCQRVYGKAKARDSLFPDSLIFCDPQAKAVFIHQTGLPALDSTQQRLIGATLKKDFIAQKDSFLIDFSQRKNPGLAAKEYQSRLRLYRLIDQKGRDAYRRYFTQMEEVAASEGLKPQQQEIQKMRQQSLNEFLIQTGYRLALVEDQTDKHDRFAFSRYPDSIFFSDKWADRYRFEMGVKALRSPSSDILKLFDFSIGKMLQTQPDQFIHETGRVRLFEFIRHQLIRESFTLTTVRYKSHETSLFHHPVAEAETNIGIFVFHQRNGEWYLVDYH